MIRIANRDDLEKITDIYNDAILNTTAVYSYKPVSLQDRIKWFESKKEPILVYIKNSKVVGFATYSSFRDWPAYDNTVEHSIYVDPNVRREGVASKLLEKLISMVKNMGFKTMVAGIDATNIGSIKLHEKFGFSECGTLKCVGYKFDNWLDLSFYQLILYE